MSEQTTKQVDFMKEQRGFMKDCTIAIMSTSALLLTLVLGFIKTPSQLKIFVGVASGAFYLAIGFAVIEFVLLFPIKSEEKIRRSAEGAFVVQAISFAFGMVFITFAILVSLFLSLP